MTTFPRRARTALVSLAVCFVGFLLFAEAPNGDWAASNLKASHLRRQLASSNFELFGVNETTIDNDVTACHCNYDYECQTKPLGQGSPLFLCFQTSSRNIEISSIQSLVFSQGALAYTSITDSGFAGDEFTAVHVNPDGDGKKAVVQTVLLGAFFANEDPGTVIASGTCTLMFLDERNGEHEHSDFRVEVAVQRRSSPSASESIFMNETVLATLMFLGLLVLIFGLCLVEALCDNFCRKRISYCNKK